MTCNESDKSGTQYIAYPYLIVEVLSDSTEAYDRGEKFYRYRRNPVLQYYVLVSAKSIAIDLYRKNDVGEWTIVNYRASDIVELKSINLSFPMLTLSLSDKAEMVQSLTNRSSDRLCGWYWL